MAQKKRNERFVVVAVGVAALGGLLFGYDTGVISGAILFIQKQFSLSSTLEEVVVSAVLVGAVIGASVGGTLADRLGRRRTIITAAITFTVGAIGTALTPSIALLIAGRVVVGLAIGVASFVSPMYISEIAPARVRGSLVSVNQLAVTVGIVVAYLVDYGFASIQGWRWMMGVAAVPSVALGLAMWRLPPSPRWLMKRNNREGARGVLRRIRPADDVEGELDQIAGSMRKQESGGAGRLLHPALRLALIFGAGLAIFQQLTGINTVIYYAPTIFRFAGVQTAGSSLLATLIVGLVNVGFTILAIRLMDRVGRRPLLLTGVAGQLLGLVLLGLAFLLRGLTGVLAYVAIVSLALYVGSFAIGLGPVFWLMISEIYPLKVRGTAMGIATLVNWAANLVVALTFLSLVNAVGRPGTFFLYGGIAAAAWVFVYFLAPETRGRTLEQIEEHWHAGGHPRELTGAAPAGPGQGGDT
jgi:SP family galactose:H+ symporter-like MFS transporter